MSADEPSVSHLRDVLEAAEEAESDLQDGLIGPGNAGEVGNSETQADLSHDAEQLGEPQRTEHVGNSTATVKVVLVPEGHVMTVAFAIGLSIAQLKLHLANELRVPADVLHIFLDGRAVDEQQSLMELGVRPNGSTRMEMSSIDPDSHPLRPLRPPEQDMPDVITVRVQTEENMFREVVVEIERPPQQKAFLGGFKHRLTGAQYHHAAVQTLPKRRADRGVVLFSRNTQVQHTGAAHRCNTQVQHTGAAHRYSTQVQHTGAAHRYSTQTVELQSEAQQCPLDASTQMTGIGCYVSCMDDKLVAPGNYITADQYHEERLRAVVVLQTFVRRWLALQEVQRLRRDRDRRLRREDFNLLYHALEKWRSEEEQQINSSLRGAERKAALCFLLETETQLIAAIGHHRIAVQNNNYDKVVRNLLDKSAAPRQWRAADGRLIEMDSEHTVRAAELRDLYINLSSESQEQRLEHLLTLRHTVKEHECQLTRDIVDLIDREADLMTRQVKVASLQGLRKRISTLFLQFIKTPAFNPEVAKHLKVPQDPSQLKNDMFQCRGCQRYLQSSDFSPTAGARLSGRCRDCTGLDNIARSRDDFSCYRNILRRLRSDEMRLNQDAKIPFLLQVEDVRYLVEVLWASRSALHSSSDLYSLVFVRWEKRRVWSPWNCILLSKEETSAHLEVDDVHKAYEVTFLRGVDHKHMLARRHFSSVPVMAEHLEPTATLGNQLVSKPVTMATGKPTAHTPAGSAH
ncbi:hypothetical protein JOQ06_021697 [Pogonophryne albipinna]|uniref:Ubiquitin-like domain-containing protein n=2 Tax=Pogonophryne albipinna TaxID=1090488 RepID=A0AAD6AE08_9TELE|nr:hypothetical protein JOQ06_021697 [Pogonophryne albipinna]